MIQNGFSHDGVLELTYPQLKLYAKEIMNRFYGEELLRMAQAARYSTATEKDFQDLIQRVQG